MGGRTTARDVAEHFDQLASARRRPDPVWSPGGIPVDGRPVGFHRLAEGRHWSPTRSWVTAR